MEIYFKPGQYCPAQSRSRLRAIACSALQPAAPAVCYCLRACVCVSVCLCVCVSLFVFARVVRALCMRARVRCIGRQQQKRLERAS
jgi:hypothetical protein